MSFQFSGLFRESFSCKLSYICHHRHHQHMLHFFKIIIVKASLFFQDHNYKGISTGVEKDGFLVALVSFVANSNLIIRKVCFITNGDHDHEMMMFIVMHF